jgi:iron-sulfur cluster assembly protein
MIQVTEKAIEKLKTLREGSKALRVSVIGGGCSGMSYKMAWTETEIIASNDKLFRFDDLQMVVDPKSYLYLAGSELDFTDGLEGQGFSWSNPNAKRSCGCGASFSA